jgi:cardiolipin synthase
LGFALGNGQWRDCGAVIFGPVCIRLGKMFDKMWEHAAGPDVTPPPLHSPHLGSMPIMALGSQPGFLNLLQYSISTLARAVHNEIRISCAYFIPTGRLRRVLRWLARHRRNCKLIIPLHNDVPMVAAASRHFLGTLLKAGVEVYRYAAETLHEKTLIYDRSVTIVGSSNLDQRSFRLNYELSVIVIGESFAAPVVRWHDADLLDSERYSLEAWQTRPLWEKVADWFWSLFRSQL